ncbi:Methyltransferase-like protein 22 [Exaiptasia diaphana]|nr:Methyltransferase-like protein 22 [Exaiptasia diaphana]
MSALCTLLTALTRFVIKQPKQNNEKDVDHGSINTVMKDDEGDFVVDRGIKYDNEPCDVIIIEHQLATVLKDVGLQVWRGALLLADYLLENEDMFAGCYGLELGAGVGLCSVVLGRVASAVFCTDFGDDVLRNCHKNAEMNAHLYKNTSVNKDEGQVSPVVKVRELDWTKGIILSSTSNGMEECYRWSKTDTDELKKVTVFFAADVIYDDKLTDALFNQVLHLLQQNQQATFYLSIEKRHRWIWREQEVLNITKQIESLCDKHDGKLVHVYLVGGPGSGKSELSRQVGLHLYETKRQKDRPMDVITIDGISITSLMSSLLDAVFALCNDTEQKADGMKQMRDELNFRFTDIFSSEETLKTERKVKIIFAKLKELLKIRNSRPVLIFDNVQDMKLLFNYLSLEPGSKQFTTFVVITAIERRVSLERFSDYVRVKELDEGMVPADSVKLLENITGLTINQDAYKLSNELDQQPLAIATAAIYIESVREGPPKRLDYSYFDYITEFKRDIYSLGMEEEIEWRESDASKYNVSMFTAVLKAVNRSAQNDPVVREIACTAGYTDSSPLSMSFVLDVFKNSTHNFTEAQIRTSLRNVLFKVHGKKGIQALSSHQVIRAAFRLVCKVSWRNPSCQNATFCNFDGVNSIETNGSLSKVFMTLALTLQHELNDIMSNLQDINASLSESNNMFGSQCLEILTSLCLFSTREGLQLSNIITTRLSSVFLQLVSHGSGFWSNIIKPPRNEFRLKEIVDLTNLQAQTGKRHDLQILLLVVCLHSGATKAQNDGLMTAINTTSMEVVQMIPVSPNKPLFLNILGIMYRGLGYPYKSKDLHNFALDLYHSTSMVNYTHHSDLKLQRAKIGEAGTLHKLGIIYRYLGNLMSAKTVHQASLMLLQKLFGSNHPYIAGSLLNLAVVYSRQGKYHDALLLHNQSLAILQQSYGLRHAHVGTVFITMGTVHYKLGNFSKAIHCTEQGLEILEDIHGPYHPRVAEALNFLGFMYRDKGLLRKAQECLERSISIKEQVFDDKHFILGEALNDLGVVYTRLGETEKAIKVLKKALHIFKRTWGESHTAVTTTLNSLGAAYCALGEARKAVSLHQTAQETLLKMTAGTSRDHLLAETRHLLGNAYLTMANVDDARKMYRLAYSGFSTLYDEKHWRVQQAQRDLISLHSNTSKNSIVFHLILVIYTSVFSLLTNLF